MSACCEEDNPGGYSECQSDRSIDRPSIWCARRYGDLVNLSHDDLLSQKNQWSWDQDEGCWVQTSDVRQSEIFGSIKEARLSGSRIFSGNISPAKPVTNLYTKVSFYGCCAGFCRIERLESGLGGSWENYRISS
ncbi:hypothetical protein TNCV_1545661 [Trichonephila clavipes]|nr:hypothetical protein TNCV_1545661 [Trichonephila clavipes]